jgi:hypothetical protein
MAHKCNEIRGMNLDASNPIGSAHSPVTRVGRTTDPLSTSVERRLIHHGSVVGLNSKRSFLSWRGNSDKQLSQHLSIDTYRWSCPNASSGMPQRSPQKYNNKQVALPPVQTDPTLIVQPYLHVHAAVMALDPFEDKDATVPKEAVVKALGHIHAQKPHSAASDSSSTALLDRNHAVMCDSMRGEKWRWKCMQKGPDAPKPKEEVSLGRNNLGMKGSLFFFGCF